MSNKTVKLVHPIEFEGKPIIELSLRRPIVADLQEVETQGGTDVDRAVTMLARLAGTKQEVIKKLDLDDFNALDKAYTDFSKAATKAGN